MTLALSLRFIAISVIIAIILRLIFVLLLPLLTFANMSMINYSGMSVESLDENQMKNLIGLKFVQGTSTDPEVITRDRLPENSRVIPPGHMVTMDWDPNRLNVHLDDEGVVKKVKKG